jgi:hypothetical protein
MAVETRSGPSLKRIRRKKLKPSRESFSPSHPDTQMEPLSEPAIAGIFALLLAAWVAMFTICRRHKHNPENRKARRLMLSRSNAELLRRRKSHED